MHATPLENTPIRTWKRMARHTTPPESLSEYSVLNKRNREIDEEDHSDLSNKKVLVSNDKITETSMAEAAVQSRQEP